MGQILQVVLYAVGLPLEFLVITAMVRSRAWRELPVAMAYSTALLLTSVIEAWVYAARIVGGRQMRSFAYFYWINEGVLQVLTFLTVVSFIYTATAGLQNRLVIRRVLIAATILFASASVAIHFDPAAIVGRWMTLVSRDISLCSAILDLALWSILLTFHPGDRRLLLLSGGLGIQFTGEAIAHSIRSLQGLPTPAIVLASLFSPVASLTCLYVWWQAFQTAPASARVPAGGGTGAGEPPCREARP